MLGTTQRRGKEAKILTNVYKSSGLGTSVQLICISDVEAMKQLEYSIKAGIQILIIDGENLNVLDDALTSLINNKYNIKYRVTDDGTYTLPAGAEAERI